jgi:hypothetical protein
MQRYEISFLRLLETYLVLGADSLVWQTICSRFHVHKEVLDFDENPFTSQLHLHSKMVGSVYSNYQATSLVSLLGSQNSTS